MRLSEWSTRAPAKESVAPKVLAVTGSVLEVLGAEPDPGCWVVWGDDPRTRYTLLVPTAAGLLQVHVRVSVPGEGPRASGKVVRWSKVSTGELAVEMADGHRLLTFQVEGQLLKGADAEADAIAAFALELFAAIDGRPFVPPARPGKGGKAGTAARGGSAPIAAGAPRGAAARSPKSPPALPAPRDGDS